MKGAQLCIECKQTFTIFQLIFLVSKSLICHLLFAELTLSFHFQ